MTENTKEKLTIRNSRGVELHSEIYRTGKPPIDTPFVILCHGFTGDRTEWGRFYKTMNKLLENGYDCLNFDFSGSGENEREIITLDKQIQDLRDVFGWCTKQGYTRISTIGLSFGGITSLAADLPDRKVSVFWAPGFYMKEVIGKRHMNLMKIAGLFLKKPMSRPSSNPEQPPILINSSFGKSISNHSPEEYLTSIKIPTLVVHGQEDNQVKIDLSRKAIKLIPKDAPHELVEIPGTGHNFNGEYLSQFIDHTIRWLNKYM